MMEMCFCGMTPTEYTCYKQGPNWMRRFLRCPKARGAQCQYLVWLEEEKSTGYQQLPPRSSQQSKRACSAREVPIPSSNSSSDSEASFKSDDSSVRGALASAVSRKVEHPAASSNQKCNHQWSRRGTNAHVKMKTCKICGLRTSQLIDAILRAYCKHLDAHQLNQTAQTLLVDHLDCTYVNPRNLLDPIVHSYALCLDTDQSSIQPLPIESRLLRLNQLNDADNLINDQEAQGETSHDVYAAEILSQRQSDESMEVEDLPAPRRRSLLREIEKAHKGMGHPHQDRFLRILKAGGASPPICSLAKTYVCSQCHENQRPKPWRRAAPPRDLAFNEVVGIDCLTVKHFSIPIKCLNIEDWGTRYQMIVPLPSASAVDVRNAYRQWVKLFGAPQLIRPDLGREFMQEFAYRCSTDGTELDPSSLEAPTQNSITEREGGSFKIMFHKTYLNYGEIQDMNEVLELIDSCMMMKNRLLNKDGFSATH